MLCSECQGSDITARQVQIGRIRSMHMLAAQSCPPRTLHVWLEVASIRAVGGCPDRPGQDLSCDRFWLSAGDILRQRCQPSLSLSAQPVRCSSASPCLVGPGVRRRRVNSVCVGCLLGTVKTRTSTILNSKPNPATAAAASSGIPAYTAKRLSGSGSALGTVGLGDY